MCGITGIISLKRTSTSFKNKEEIFEDLVHLTEKRGRDSFGAFTLKSDDLNKVNIYKSTSLPSLALDEKKYKKIVGNTITQSPIVIGHCRAATFGNITSENAHPFYEGNTVLVHNGNVSNFAQLSTKGQFEVDSNFLCHYIDQNKYDIKQTLSEVSGAYAVIWYDTAEHTLNVVRNDERTLFYVISNDHIFINSEKGALLYALDRWGIRIQWEDVKAFHKNTLYTYFYDKDNELVFTELKVKFKETTYSFYGNNTKYDYMKYFNSMPYSAPKETTSPKTTEIKEVSTPQVGKRITFEILAGEKERYGRSRLQINGKDSFHIIHIPSNVEGKLINFIHFLDERDTQNTVENLIGEIVAIEPNGNIHIDFDSINGFYVSKKKKRVVYKLDKTDGLPRLLYSEKLKTQISTITKSEKPPLEENVSIIKPLTELYKCENCGTYRENGEMSSMITDMQGKVCSECYDLAFGT